MKLKPCAHCEEELPMLAFTSPGALFCKSCTQKAVENIRAKYGVIAAAHFRAQLRQKIHQPLPNVRLSSR